MRISDWSSDVCSSDLDRVHVDFGMPMGPFQMSDLAGVDIGWHRDPMRVESIRDALAAETPGGPKTQAGFYDHHDKRNPHPSPRVDQIIEDFRHKTEPNHHEVTYGGIVQRPLYPVDNGGHRTR